jgi:hypothetical protein
VNLGAQSLYLRVFVKLSGLSPVCEAVKSLARTEIPQKAVVVVMRILDFGYCTAKE